MSSRVSDRASPVVVPKSKVEAEAQVNTPAPSPNRPAGWTAPSDKPNDGWKSSTAPRPSIVPPTTQLKSDAPVLSARDLMAAQPAPQAAARTLKRGMEGADVRQLQARLNELGFNAPTNGTFDAATKRAVESFQGSRGLTVDGDAGRNTFRELGAASSPRAAPEFTGRTLKRGMSGDDVSQLQESLRKQGQNVRVTGSYDAATERAVENFQRARGLQVDGDAGRQTQTALGITGKPTGIVSDNGPSVITRPQPQPQPQVVEQPHVHDHDHDHGPADVHTPSAPVTIAANAAFGDVAERNAIAARITIGRGANTNEADIAAVRAEVAKLPLDQLRDLQRAGINVVACRDNVPDAVPSLAGVQPRGWAPGRTWNDVPGAYMPSTKEVIVATRAGGASGREVPPLGHGHGSVSLVAHEVGHAVDAARNYPSKNNAEFQAAYQRDLGGGQLLPYYTQAGEAGASEAYAESLAIYMSGDPNGDGARRFPALMGYWQAQYRPENAS